MRFAQAVSVSFTLLFLGILAPCYGQDTLPVPPKPAAIVIEGPKGDLEADGSFEKPFVFTLGSKGKLILNAPEVTDEKKIEWNLDNAPKEDIEILPGKKIIWFPTNVNGMYHAFVGVSNETGLQLTHAWFKIEGTIVPPAPEKQLTLDMKAGFVGPDAKVDAAAYKKAVDGLRDLFEKGEITKTEDMVATFKKGLEVAGWKSHKYPGITKVAGEHLGGPTTPGHDLSAEEIQTFKDKLKIMSDACATIISAK